MIWFSSKKYTPEYYAQKMDNMRQHATRSMRCMVLIVVCAAVVQLLAGMACAYCL